MQRKSNTEYILSLSYGKDSLACLEAIRLLGYPLDRVVHAEVWATDTIPADLPPMVDFKAYADKQIKERYGITVEHICAMRNGEKLTYEKLFYHIPKRKSISDERNLWQGLPNGFPLLKGSYCKKLKINAIGGWAKKGRYCEATGQLKTSPFKDFYKSCSQPLQDTTNKTVIQYLGIAADEPERIIRHTAQGKVLPLVDIGWSEERCRKWCEDNNLLSPIYTTATRGGCWFCHNQSIEQLRLLRKSYPDLWLLLLKWDLDSPIPFHPDGHTVHDFEKRFELEDKGLVPTDRKFRWKMLNFENRSLV